ARLLLFRRRARPTLFPYTTLFRSQAGQVSRQEGVDGALGGARRGGDATAQLGGLHVAAGGHGCGAEGGLQGEPAGGVGGEAQGRSEEHSLNSSHVKISYAVFCLKK